MSILDKTSFYPRQSPLVRLPKEILYFPLLDSNVYCGVKNFDAPQSKSTILIFLHGRCSYPSNLKTPILLIFEKSLALKGCGWHGTMEMATIQSKPEVILFNIPYYITFDIFNNVFNVFSCSSFNRIVE